MAKLLIIAGSDSGGGAGIQADLKTASFLGVYATTAITAITAQNTLGVQGVEAVSAAMVRAQIQSVLSDIGADAVKTGMLFSAEIISEVAYILASHPQIPLVVDPVMVAKGGASLLEQEAISALQQQLMPLASVVTPNIPEAELLASTLISNQDGMVYAARRILKQTRCKAVLMKGGHLHPQSDTVVDLLVTDQDAIPFTSPRIASRHTHGTGCTLASAVAAHLAQGIPLPIAVEKARFYVMESIKNAPMIGKGHGPLGHGWVLTQHPQ
jgi:hydroxymethylpyrimidine/phosphomethylpyrimidine kinase